LLTQLFKDYGVESGVDIISVKAELLKVSARAKRAASEASEPCGRRECKTHFSFCFVGPHFVENSLNSHFAQKDALGKPTTVSNFERLIKSVVCWSYGQLSASPFSEFFADKNSV